MALLEETNVRLKKKILELVNHIESIKDNSRNDSPVNTNYDKEIAVYKEMVHSRDLTIKMLNDKVTLLEAKFNDLPNSPGGNYDMLDTDELKNKLLFTIQQN